MHPEAKAAVPRLITAVRSRGETESQVALHALMRIAPREEATLAVVRETIRDEKSPLATRILACLELSDLGEIAQSSITDMLALFDSQSGEMPLQIPKWRFSYRRDSLLGKAATLKSATLEEVQADFDEHPRVNILIALGRLGPNAKVALPRLEQIVRDRKERFDVRWFSAWCLRQIGAEAKAAITTLVAVFGDAEQDPDLRREVAAALTHIGPEGIQEMIKALDSPEWTAKFLALEALEELGPRAKEALPAIEKIRRGEDRLLVRAAEFAMGKIEGGRK